MSWVTNILLSLETLDADEDQKVAEINEFFSAPGHGGFVSLEDDSLPNGWYRSGKCLEAHLYLGVFNHLDLASLIAHIRSLEWPGPTSVQLLVKDQEETKFKAIDVVEHGWSDWQRE